MEERCCVVTTLAGAWDGMVLVTNIRKITQKKGSWAFFLRGECSRRNRAIVRSRLANVNVALLSLNKCRRAGRRRHKSTGGSGGGGRRRRLLSPPASAARGDDVRDRRAPRQARAAVGAGAAAVVAKRQNGWAGNDVACTSLVETFHFRKQFSVSQPCGAGC